MKKSLVILFTVTTSLIFFSTNNVHAQSDKNYSRISLSPFRTYQFATGRKKSPVINNGNANGTNRKVQNKVRSKQKKSVFRKTLRLAPSSPLNRQRKRNKTLNKPKRNL